MDLYILGIGGTFMGHLALLAKQLGFNVSGCDQNVYSPMKEMLINNNIDYDEGYSIDFLKSEHQLYVIGNSISRGNPMIEYILNNQRPYTSGPAWLRQRLLQNKWVIAVAGTHGKTTTTSMVTWILKYLGYKPGYLIGGAAKGLERAADIGDSDYFVIEADEYDTAFFDKRSKFIHYGPKTLILNNLEYDHADIFESIKDIKKTMHHLVRTVPGQGAIIFPDDDEHLRQVLDMGCWTETWTLHLHKSNSEEPRTGLNAYPLKEDGSQLRFVLLHETGEKQDATLSWLLIGRHNMANAAAAIAAVAHIGVSLADAASALSKFNGVTRRMDLRYTIQNIKVYDDFAHHPTAIASSLEGLRSKVGQDKIIAFVEPRSNTMKMGIHQQSLIDALIQADEVYWLAHGQLGFDLPKLCEGLSNHFICTSAEEMLNLALSRHQKHMPEKKLTHWLCMSNGAFGGFFDLIAQSKLSPGCQ